MSGAKQAFSQIIGHSEEVDYLLSLLKNGSLPHAMIFNGPDGIGKFAVARALAAAIFHVATFTLVVEPHANLHMVWRTIGKRGPDCERERG